MIVKCKASKNYLMLQNKRLWDRVKELEEAFKRYAGHKEECLLFAPPEYFNNRSCDCGYQTIRDTIK